MGNETMVIRKVGSFDVPMLPSELNHHDIERMVGEVVKQAPSYPKLLRAYISLRKSLYTYRTTAEIMSEIEGNEGALLTAHAGVMRAKSARALTLQRLANDVFKETKLPRNPQGKFRGEDNVNTDKFIKSRGIEYVRYDGQIGAIYRPKVGNKIPKKVTPEAVRPPAEVVTPEAVEVPVERGVAIPEDSPWLSSFKGDKWTATINGFPLQIVHQPYDLSGRGLLWRITTQYTNEMFANQFYKTANEAKAAAEGFVKAQPRGRAREPLPTPEIAPPVAEVEITLDPKKVDDAYKWLKTVETGRGIGVLGSVAGFRHRVYEHEVLKLTTEEVAKIPRFQREIPAITWHLPPEYMVASLRLGKKGMTKAQAIKEVETVYIPAIQKELRARPQVAPEAVSSPAGAVELPARMRARKRRKKARRGRATRSSTTAVGLKSLR